MRTADFLLLTALLAAALAWPLSSPPIASHGEAREGLVVQDIVQHGRWVLPYRNGELPSKPPLFHWIAAAAARGFGLSDLTVRLPSGLAAWAMALATFMLGAALGGRLTGWLAVGVLAGTHGFWESASEARVDMVFAACVTMALAAFFFWYRDRNPIARAVCYLAVASAVLAKGPAGAVLPSLVGFAFLVREHGRRVPRTSAGFWAVVRAFWSWPLVGLVLVVDLGWYALAYRLGGNEFLAVQLVRENFERFAGRGDFGMHGGRPVFSMLLHLVTDIVPWNLVLLWAAAEWARGVREDEGGRFLHTWWLTILAFFTVAYGKRDVYLLPLYPAIALLAGRALASALAGLTPDTPRVFGLVPVPAFVRRAFPRRPALALVALAIVGFDVVLLGVGQTAREVSERQKSLAPFAHEIGRQLPRAAALYAEGSLSDSDLIVLAYRLKRFIPRGPGATASGPPAAGQPVYVLVPGSALDGFAAGRFERVVVSRRRGVEVALVLLQPPVAGALTKGGAVS